MTYPIPNLIPAIPEIFLLAAASIILIIDSFLSQKNRVVTFALTQLAILGCACATLITFRSGITYTFNGMFVDDLLSDLIKFILYLATALTLVYSRKYLIARGMYRGEFFVLTLFAMLGMMVMVSANSLLTLYLGLELLSLCLYALVALQRDSRVATEASMKYFVLGALASGVLLYGMSMIYGATGSLELGKIATAIATNQVDRMVLVFGLVFLVTGICFKFGIAPFHMWVPDVYHGAPTAVTLIISTTPKLAMFGFTMRLLVEALHGLVLDWQGMLIVLAVLSMAIGNITAIAQTNLKRMLAYSSISHMGFLLLGILSGDINGYSSALFYIVVYAVMSLGTFGMIIVLSREGFEAENLNDFKGLNTRNPWYAFIMLMLMFSLAGIPPMVGFYAKLSVLQAVLSAGYIWLTVTAVIFSLIGAFYYLRVVKLMYFDAPEDNTPLRAPLDVCFLMSLNGLAVLGFGIMPGWLVSLCDQAIRDSL